MFVDKGHSFSKEASSQREIAYFQLTGTEGRAVGVPMSLHSTLHSLNTKLPGDFLSHMATRSKNSSSWAHLHL